MWPFARYPSAPLAGTRLRWVAVPGLKSGAFLGRHPAARNALSFRHHLGPLLRGPALTRRPALAALAALDAAERAHPDCVIFVTP